YRTAIGAHTGPYEFAATIVEHYANMVGRDHLPYTIAALDMSHIDPMAAQIKDLAQALQHYLQPAGQVDEDHRRVLSDIRDQVQKFDSNGDFQIGANDGYIDLFHWATLLKQVQDSTVQNAAGALLSTLPDFIRNE